jgi:hypothetical protein
VLGADFEREENARVDAEIDRRFTEILGRDWLAHRTERHVMYGREAVCSVICGRDV